MNYGINFLRKNDGLLDCIITYKIDGVRKQTSKRGFKNQKDAKPWIDETLERLGFESLEERNSEFMNKISEE